MQTCAWSGRYAACGRSGLASHGLPFRALLVANGSEHFKSCRSFLVRLRIDSAGGGNAFKI